MHPFPPLVYTEGVHWTQVAKGGKSQTIWPITEYRTNMENGHGRERSTGAWKELSVSTLVASLSKNKHGIVWHAKRYSIFTYVNVTGPHKKEIVTQCCEKCQPDHAHFGTGPRRKSKRFDLTWPVLYTEKQWFVDAGWNEDLPLLTSRCR